MKMRRGVVRGAWVLAAVCGALLPSAPVLAQASAAEVVQAGNRIEKIVAAEQGGNVVLKLTMAKPLAAAPGSFSVASPARVAFDFPDTGNGLGRNSQQLNAGDLRSVNIVQVGDRTRLVGTASAAKVSVKSAYGKAEVPVTQIAASVLSRVVGSMRLWKKHARAGIFR